MQGFYEEVANPLLTNVEVDYPENAILDLTRNSYPHFYDGSEIVVAGRLADRNVNNFKADVKGHGVSGDGRLGHAENQGDGPKASWRGTL